MDRSDGVVGLPSSGGCLLLRLFAFANTLADEGQDVSSVVYGIIIVVVSTDRNQIGAKVDIVENGVGDRAWRPDQGGRRAAGIGGGNCRIPECAVMDVAALGDIQQTLGPDIGRRRCIDRGTRQALLAVLVQTVENPVRLFPGQFIRFGDDRPECNPDPGRSVRPAFAASA